MQPKRIIHIRIRDLRRERELTQEELADALGISRQSINAMEAGRCLPSLPVALEIASYFAVPLNQLIAMADEHQRLLQEQLEHFLPALPAPKGPAANIAENESFVEVELMLPGFKKDDIDLEVGHDFITVSGKEQDEQTLVRQEFTAHSFSRTIQLPSPVDTDSATAQMQHGILTIRLKKLYSQNKTKRLEIVDR
jgi:HSP20 family molecular chaperone IbpA